MAKKRDEMADGMIADEADGWLANLLADEEPYDRKMLWQLGSWAAAALGALAFAFLAAQSTNIMRSDIAAANELVRQTQQIALAANERESETRRLVAAIDTLNSDRDRLYSRMSGLEQNVDSVTSSIKQQTRTLVAPAPLPTAPAVGAAPETIAPASSLPPSSAPPASSLPAIPASKADKDASPAKPAPAAAAKPEKLDAAKIDAAKPEPAKSEPEKSASVKSTEAEKPVDAAKSAEAPKPAEPQPGAPAVADAASATAAPPSPIVTAAIPPLDSKADAPEIPAAKTEFGVDLGTASSVEGLRALWRAVQTSNKQVMGPLRPVIAIKERSGLGMQLRLVAGPLTDAAAAARICAVLSEKDRPCETAFFDGQRLTPSPDLPAAKPAPPPRRKSSRANRRVTTFVAQQRPSRNGLSSFLGSN